MSNLELARWYSGLLGALLVVIGLAGFVDNPIIGRPSNEPVFYSGAVLNAVHVASGALALFIAFGLLGTGLIRGLIGFGLAYALLLALTVASPRLLGLLDVPVNLACNVLHAGVAVVSIAVGWLARGGERRELGAG